MTKFEKNEKLITFIKSSDVLAFDDNNILYAEYGASRNYRLYNFDTNYSHTFSVGNIGSNARKNAIMKFFNGVYVI